MRALELGCDVATSRLPAKMKISISVCQSVPDPKYFCTTYQVPSYPILTLALEIKIVHQVLLLNRYNPRAAIFKGHLCSDEDIKNALHLV